jgi:hypothetical protein
MAMDYILGPSLEMSGDLMMTITNAWLTFGTFYPLYAVRFTESHAKGRSFVSTVIVAMRYTLFFVKKIILLTLQDNFLHKRNHTKT